LAYELPPGSQSRHGTCKPSQEWEIAVASGGQARLKEARYVAESSIGFLKNKPTWANTRIGETEQAQTAVSNAKALMCFRAHIVVEVEKLM
jgi:hypothetical protein